MKKNIYLLFFFLCLTRNPAVGNCLFLSGEFLYLQPNFGPTYFVINNTLLPVGFFDQPLSGDSVNNQMPYAPGFRVEGGMGFQKPLTISIGYTQFNIAHTTNENGRNLLLQEGVVGSFDGITNFAGTASRYDKIIFQSAEARAKYLFISRPCCEIDVQGAIQWSSCFHDENVNARTVSGDTYAFFRQSRSLLLGLIAGLQVRVPFFLQSLHITGEMNGGCFTSKAYEKLSFTNSTLIGFFPKFDVHLTPTWRLVPYLNCKIGLLFHPKYFPHIALEGGFEYTAYIQALSRSLVGLTNFSFPDDTHFDTVSFQGLYLKANIYF